MDNRKTALIAAGFASLLNLASVGSAWAVANSVGWVWASQPTAIRPYTPPAAYSYNSRGGSMTITRTSTGSYTVKFGKLFIGGAVVEQLSAYDTSGYCMGEDITFEKTYTIDANVSCFDASGSPADTAFTLLVQERFSTLGGASAGLAFLYDECPTSNKCTPQDSYNSRGKTNTIVLNSTGNYTVTVPGLTATGGDVQVTADDSGGLPGTSLCKVGSWTNGSGGAKVNILCFDGTGAPTDYFYDLDYSLNEPFGLVPGVTTHGAYAWANCSSCTKVYTPDTTYQYNGFGTGNLTAQKTGTGQYVVTIPGSLSYKHSTVLVTAYGTGTSYCNTVSWSARSINVECFSGGTPADSEFDLTFQTSG